MSIVRDGSGAGGLSGSSSVQTALVQDRVYTASNPSTPDTSQTSFIDVTSSLYDVPGRNYENSGLTTTRHIELNGTDAYYELAQSITFAGDFELRFDLSTLVDVTSSGGHIVASSGSGAFRVALWQDKILISVSSGDNSSFDVSSIDFSNINSLMVSRLEGKFYCKVNGVDASPILDIGTTNTITVDSIGKVWGASTSIPAIDGIISNVKFTDLSDELFTTFVTVEGSGSSYVGDTLTLVQDGGNDKAVSNFGVTEGADYDIEYDIISNTLSEGGELRVTTSGGNQTIAVMPSSVGHHKIKGTAALDNDPMTLRIGNESNGNGVVLEGFSVRESAVTTTFALDEPTADIEQSVEDNNSVTYNNIASEDRLIKSDYSTGNVISGLTEGKFYEIETTFNMNNVAGQTSMYLELVNGIDDNVHYLRRVGILNKVDPEHVCAVYFDFVATAEMATDGVRVAITGHRGSAGTAVYDFTHLIKEHL